MCKTCFATQTLNPPQYEWPSFSMSGMHKGKFGMVERELQETPSGGHSPYWFLRPSYIVIL